MTSRPELRSRIADLLATAEVDVGPREADWLLEAAERRAPGDQVERIALELAGRRAKGEPLQYVIGTAAFRHLELSVGPGVLVPRPETEVLVERALDRLPQDGSVVDVGTGSGAIALAIRHERPDTRVWATDDSEEALRYARDNGRGSTSTSRFYEGACSSLYPVRCAATSMSSWPIHPTYRKPKLISWDRTCSSTSLITRCSEDAMAFAS